MLQFPFVSRRLDVRLSVKTWCDVFLLLKICSLLNPISGCTTWQVLLNPTH